MMGENRQLLKIDFIGLLCLYELEIREGKYWEISLQTTAFPCGGSQLVIFKTMMVRNCQPRFLF